MNPLDVQEYSKEQCKQKNWNEKLEKIAKVLDLWRKHHLTLFGKIIVIKTLALPKIIYVATILPIPENVTKMFYNFCGRRKIVFKDVV